MTVQKISLLIGILLAVGSLVAENFGFISKLAAFAAFHTGLAVLLLVAFIAVSRKLLTPRETKQGE